jgi:hypothetical protein
VANYAGASEPMQIGIGAAGDEYDALPHFLSDPSLGPHDPTTAVQLAALVLIKDKGAPNRPADRWLPVLRARLQQLGPCCRRVRRGYSPNAHAYECCLQRPRYVTGARHQGADSRRWGRGRASCRDCRGSGDDHRRQAHKPLPVQLRGRTTATAHRP